jgi:LuxR family transcriptional activator of bioluminescence operon
MSNDLEKLEHKFAAATSIATCNEALRIYFLTLNISTYSFTYYAHHPDSVNKLKYDMCSRNFQVWHQHYLEEQYNNIDSLMDFVYHHHLPIYWDVRQQLAQAKTDDEKNMRQAALDFGAHSGLSIPIHGAQNNFAILLVVRMQEETCNLQNLSLQHDLMIAAHLYFHYIQIHLLENVNESAAFKLTQREIQCLLLIAKQHNVAKMAQILELSERTVNFHIQKINKKLGTKNKYQSLAKALKLRLLTL